MDYKLEKPYIETALTWQHTRGTPWKIGKYKLVSTYSSSSQVNFTDYRQVYAKYQFGWSKMRVAGISLVKNIDRVVRRGVALHLTCSKDCIYSPRAAGLRLTRQNLYLNQVFLYLKSDHTKSWRNFSHGNRTTRAGGSTATPTSCAVDVHVVRGCI